MRAVLGAFSALTLLLVSQELVLRAVFPVREVLNFDRYHYSLLVPSAEARSDNLGHASFTWVSEPDGYEFVHRLNLYGFRDEEWRLGADPDVTRVAFVGDSMVEGFSSDAESAIPATFERLAAAAGRPVDALNLGVGGNDLRSHSEIIRDSVPLFRPESVVLVLYAQDLTDRDVSAALLDDVLEPEYAHFAQARLLHVLAEHRRGHRVPRRWISAPFPYLAPVPDPRSALSQARYANRVEKLVSPDLFEAMKRGRLSYELAGFFPWAAQLTAEPVVAAPILEALSSYTAALGARLMVVYLPLKVQVSDRYAPFVGQLSAWGTVEPLTGERHQVQARSLARSCHRLGIPFLDLTPGLRQLESEGPALYWNFDEHLRPRGYRAAADLVFQWWRRESS